MTSWDALLKTIESHPGTAAWVQAIFSIVGIAVAIAVPFAIWRVERHDRQIDRVRRSENLVQSLIGDVFPLLQQIALLRADLRDGSHEPPREDDGWYRWFAGAGLQVPKSLEDAMPNMHDMEAVRVDPLRDLCNSVKTYNAYLAQYRASDVDAWNEIRPMICDNLELAAFCATKVMALYAHGDRLTKMIASAGLDDVKEPVG